MSNEENDKKTGNVFEENGVKYRKTFSIRKVKETDAQKFAVYAQKHPSQGQAFSALIEFTARTTEENTKNLIPDEILKDFLDDQHPDAESVFIKLIEATKALAQEVSRLNELLETEKTEKTVLNSEIEKLKTEFSGKKTLAKNEHPVVFSDDVKYKCRLLRKYLVRDGLVPENNDAEQINAITNLSITTFLDLKYSHILTKVQK